MQTATPSSPDRHTLRGDQARAFLRETYGVDLRHAWGVTEPRMTHSRWSGHRVAIDRFAYSGNYDYAADGVQTWRVVRAAAGAMRTRFGSLQRELGAGQAYTTEPGSAFDGVNLDLTATVVSLDLDLVRRTLGPEADADAALSLDNARTVSGPALQVWDDTVDYVLRVVLARPEVAASPLVVGHAERLLAGTALELFTARYGLPGKADDAEAAPGAVRRAMAFAEANRDADIGVAEMAAAARVTPRALQYAFRRHLETTPEAWLRSMRLACAHEELLDADADTVTVGAIAARWGFYHQGRFAAAYRERYGRPPGQTLRT